MEMLAVRKRCVATRLRKAISVLITMGQMGVLPQTARWILGSSLIFLEKPGKDTPRPIRCGEWMRKVIAKSLIRDNKVHINALMRRLSQFGVALPGGAEALYHARATMEAAGAAGLMGEFAMGGCGPRELLRKLRVAIHSLRLR